MILFKPRLDVSIEKITSDDHGRYILTEIVIDNTKIILVTLFFFNKNLFYKNVEAEIDPNFKNVLRTFLRLRVD